MTVPPPAVAAEHSRPGSPSARASREQWRELVAAVLARSGAAALAGSARPVGSGKGGRGPDGSGDAGSGDAGSGDDGLGNGGRGDDPELALIRTTLAGIDVRPLYTARDAPHPVGAGGIPGRAPFVRGASAARGWDVRQRHVADGSAGVTAAIRADLANGVTSVWLEVDSAGAVTVALDALGSDALGSDAAGSDAAGSDAAGSDAAGSDAAGSDAAGSDAVGSPLVVFDAAAVVLDAGSQTLDVAEALLSSPAGARWRGNIGADPIGLAHRGGTAVDLSMAVAALNLCAGRAGLRPIVVDGTVFHDAGATDVDEVGIVTAAGVAYLRTLTDAGATITAASAALEFRLAVTDDQFGSMAKLRAARLVWHRVGELCGAAPPDRAQWQHAVTSAAMTTRRDPYLNVVRATVAGFAAAVSGARAITVAPFDQALGRTDASARRIARNTQAVLHDEVSLARVADPAGGSFYVEALTAELARRAWDSFTALERAGGATDLAAVAALVGRSRGRREAVIASGRFPITGVNRFADPDERPLPRERSGALGPTGGLPRIRYPQADEASWAP